MIPKIDWPQGKRFSFTVIDDPDGITVESRKWVYPFLADLGFRTSIAVWPIGPLRERNSKGETCADKEYREHLLRMQEIGFEISYHNAAPHSCTRDEIIQSLDVFRDIFGAYPRSVANHYNADALYWGAARLHSPVCRALYHLLTRGSQRDRFFGHIEGSPYFWGDLCRERTQYFRNFVFREINTLKACPYQPYHSPERPYVREWFSASEGTDCRSFLKTISEPNQDRLEAEGGMSIMYTHFGKGFVTDGKLDPEFRRLMTRISKRNPWLAPVSSLMDHCRAKKGPSTISHDEIARLEWKWLAVKAIHGTS
jgi:hypothetical protein